MFSKKKMNLNSRETECDFPEVHSVQIPLRFVSSMNEFPRNMKTYTLLSFHPNIKGNFSSRNSKQKKKRNLLLCCLPRTFHPSSIVLRCINQESARKSKAWRARAARVWLGIKKGWSFKGFDSLSVLCLSSSATPISNAGYTFTCISIYVDASRLILMLFSADGVTISHFILLVRYESAWQQSRHEAELYR